MISDKLQVKINSLDQVKEIYVEHKLFKEQRGKFEKDNLLLKE